MKRTMMTMCGLGVVGALLLGPITALAGDDQECNGVTASGTSVQSLPPDGPFEGSVTITLGEGVPKPGTIVTTALCITGIDEDGTIHGRTTHTFSFLDDGTELDGTFTTIDEVVMVPNPPDQACVYDLFETLEIVSGTNDFDDTHGVLMTPDGTNGVIDLCLGEASFEYVGEICFNTCEADANLDGEVDPLDTGFVLARFGCPVSDGTPSCDTDTDCDLADQNGDGAVDPLDVGFILSRLGTCD